MLGPGVVGRAEFRVPRRGIGLGGLIGVSVLISLSHRLLCVGLRSSV